MISITGVVLLSFCVIIICDAGLALYARRVYPPHGRRSWLRDLPSIPFVACAALMKILSSGPITDDVVGTLIILLAGMAMVMWEILDGVPVHPVVAGLLGLLMGGLFWPVG